jgi:predicted Kef-type K+ transport protein
MGLLPEDGQDLILAGALFSIALNPLLFHAVRSLYPPRTINRVATGVHRGA